MEYTKEEKKTINKAFETILSDLEEIWKKSGNVSVSTPLTLNSLKDVNRHFYKEAIFRINKVSVYLSVKDMFLNIDSIQLITNKLNSKNKKFPLSFKSEFIQQYPELRKIIVRKIAIQKETENQQNMEIKEQKEREMKAIKSIESMYSRTVDIEIDLPKTQNHHPIEITEEDGEKIGTLHFGGRTIRIITSGDIVLINKKEQKQKVNRK